MPDNHTGDLNSQQDRILGINPERGHTVREAEVQRCSQDLGSMTDAPGHYSIEFDHYRQAL